MKKVAISFTDLWQKYATGQITLTEISQLDCLCTGCTQSHIMAQGVPMEITWHPRRIGGPTRFDYRVRSKKGLPKSLLQKWKGFKKEIQRLDQSSRVIWKVNWYSELADWITTQWPHCQVLNNTWLKPTIFGTRKIGPEPKYNRAVRRKLLYLSRR